MNNYEPEHKQLQWQQSDEDQVVSVLNNQRAKEQSESEVKLHSFLNSEIKEDEEFTSVLYRSSPEKSAADIY